MTATKWLTPPELITRGDRGYKLSLHTKKRMDGKSQDYRAAGKAVLWRFTVRAPQGTHSFGHRVTSRYAECLQDCTGRASPVRRPPN